MLIRTQTALNKKIKIPKNKHFTANVKGEETNLPFLLRLDPGRDNIHTEARPEGSARDLLCCFR